MASEEIYLARARKISVFKFVKISLPPVLHVMMKNATWEPVQNLVFLGMVLDFETGLISIPGERILKLESSIDSCLQDNFISARGLASITGQIISMSCAVGNVTRLLTRNCYAAIEQRTFWDQLLFVSPEFRNELSFWQSNIDSINGKSMSPKSSAVGVVYILTQVTLDLVVISFNAARI